MIDLANFGYIETEAPPEGQIPARITQEHRDLYHAVCKYGECRAVLTGAFTHAAEGKGEHPTVGDFVWIKYNPHGDSGITKRLERRSKFSRSDFSGHAAGYVKTVLEQVVAANFDYVFILSSLNLDFHAGRIARYLTQARQSGAMPVVLLTKSDLCADAEPYLRQLSSCARGVDVIALSSVTGQGLDRLGDYLKPRKTAVFLGMSGVGKSSLVNALCGEQIMTVKEIREDDARGRHTTTHRQLVTLPSGAMIIDTPGMRELGLWLDAEAVQDAFDDVEQIIARCRFSDCRHRTEPGCAVRQALDAGELTEKHWGDYQKQIKEARFVEYRAKKSRENAAQKRSR